MVASKWMINYKIQIMVGSKWMNGDFTVVKDYIDSYLAYPPVHNGLSTKIIKLNTKAIHWNGF